MFSGNPLFATKSVDQLRRDAEGSHGLKRTLTATDLVLLGIGAIIGTGIFVITGHAAAANAGPRSCCRSSSPDRVGVRRALLRGDGVDDSDRRSAYTYSYATMGELIAWTIGWDLILEYAMGAATVSVGWSGYVVAFVRDFMHINLPVAWTTAPFAYDEVASKFVSTGAILNVPAVFITVLATIILVVGIKESARFNGVIVFVKVIVVLLFITIGSRFVRRENWHPFIPPNEGPGRFGFSGIMRGASAVFFAYIGFDAVSTAAQETKNPQKDLPTGILGSLAICTVLYIAASLVLTASCPSRSCRCPTRSGWARR